MNPTHAHHQPLPITIIGQGLAGSLLAWQLLEHHMHITIISDQQASASRVAAGLINPITGTRFVLAAQTPGMLKYASQFYQDIEKKLNICCYFPTSIHRFFQNHDEQLRCEKRLKQTEYQAFLGTTIPNGIIQQHAARLDTNVLLDGLQAYFAQHPRVTLRNANTSAALPVAGINIYCEGYKVVHNPLFSWLPMQPSHGEIISCSSPTTLPPEARMQCQWVLPTSEHICRIGATFDPDIKQPTLHEKSRHALMLAGQRILGNTHLTLTKHEAGIRPNTIDKQPFIGFHPRHHEKAIFNGFGSRGSLLIPWYAHAFCNTLLAHTPLPQEANILRYAQRCV